MKKFIILVVIAFALPVIGVYGLFYLKEIEFAKNKGQQKNVILISVDSLRPDFLSCYNDAVTATPGVNSLATRGLVFSDVYSTAPMTLTSRASMFSGLYPDRHGYRLDHHFTLADSTDCLAEQFQQQGYQCTAIISSYDPDKQQTLYQGFDEVQTLTASTNVELSVDMMQTVTQTAMDRIMRDKSKPFFLFLNYSVDPNLLQTAKQLHSTTAVDDYAKTVTLFDSQLQFLLNFLAELGLEDNTIVMLTSGHGTALGEHGEWGHGSFLYNSTLQVPLVIAGLTLDDVTQVARPASLVDIMPTLLAAAKLPIPDDLDGQNLLTAPAANTMNRIRYFESYSSNFNNGYAPLRGLQQGDWKLLTGIRTELFQLSEDRKENHDLWASNADNMAALRLALKQRSEGLFQSKMFSAPIASSIHPADQAVALNQIQIAIAAVRQGDYFLAATLLDEIQLQSNTQMLEVLWWRAKLKRELNDASGAEFCLRTLLLKNEMYLDAYLELGEILTEQGDFLQARLWLSTGVDLYPENVDLRYQIAKSYFKEGRLESALTRFNTVLQLDNDRAEIHEDYLRCLIALQYWDEALQISVELRQRFTKYPAFYLHHAKILRQKKDYRVAKNTLLKGLELAQQRNEFFKQLAMVYKDLSQLNLALVYADYYLKNRPHDVAMQKWRREIVRLQEEQ